MCFSSALEACTMLWFKMTFHIEGGRCIPFKFVRNTNIWIAFNMFCATSICCVQLQICFQGIMKLRTHTTHIVRSSSSIATFPKMHSNCFAHNVIKINYSYCHANVFQATFQPQTWHHFVFLCPPSSQSLHYSITTSLHYTTSLLVSSIWWEPVFSAVFDVSLAYNMFSVVVCWPNSEAPTTTFGPRDQI